MRQPAGEPAPVAAQAFLAAQPGLHRAMPVNAKSWTETA
jgi:hypothetical protein